MKTIKTLLFFLISLQSFGQTNFKSNTNIHLYGGTDWYGLIYAFQFNDTITEFGENEFGENIKIVKEFDVAGKTTTGCWGTRIEHFLTRKISVGLDFWYAKTTVTAICTRKDYIQDFGLFSNQVPISVNTAIISKNLSRLNSTIRFDLHFGRSRWIDPYVNVAMGAAVYKFITTSSNTSVHEETPLYIPFSFKAGGGAKAWFNDKLAAFVELNIGGPLISGGICYKFPQKIKVNFKENSN